MTICSDTLSNEANFHYLSLSKYSNAAKAITYHPYINSLSVMDCYYNYYDPVKGYSLSYRQRAQMSRIREKEIRNLLFKKLYSMAFIIYLLKEYCKKSLRYD